jgi:hypothetical protein
LSGTKKNWNFVDMDVGTLILGAFAGGIGIFAMANLYLIWKGEDPIFCFGKCRSKNSQNIHDQMHGGNGMQGMNQNGMQPDPHGQYIDHGAQGQPHPQMQPGFQGQPHPQMQPGFQGQPAMNGQQWMNGQHGMNGQPGMNVPPGMNGAQHGGYPMQSVLPQHMDIMGEPTIMGRCIKQKTGTSKPFGYSVSHGESVEAGLLNKIRIFEEV